MSLKNIKIKSAFAAIAIFTTITTTSVQAKIQYHAGIGYGISLFEFNGAKADATFQGDIAVPGPGILGGAPDKVMIRTSYKYIDNLPQRGLFLDAGFIHSLENITMLDRNFFYGGFVGFTWDKLGNSYGLINPKAKYRNTGSTGLFFSINGRFGLENNYSKLFGIFGFTVARTDLPFDILPFGDGTQGGGGLATCAVLDPNSDFFQYLTPQQQAIITNACNSIKVDNATYNTFFATIGGGAETKITENLNLFAEYVYFLQLNKNKIHEVNYSVLDQAGTFKGKIRTTNTQSIKAGLRYYF